MKKNKMSLKNSLKNLINNIIELKFVLILPLIYFFVCFINIYFCIPYFWYGELTLIFILIVLFVFAEVNKIFNTKFSIKSSESVLARSVCLNVIIMFTMNAFYITVLRFFINCENSHYNLLVFTETSYLGSTVVVDLVRLFISLIFIISMWYSLSYTKIRKDISYEFYGFLGILCCLVLLCVSCKNLFLFFLLVEAISFLLIGLICFSKTRPSFEIALKFFVISGLFTLIGLLGCVVVYASFHTLDYRAIRLISASILSGAVVFSKSSINFVNFGVILIFISILFKLGSFPFHIYVADYASESYYPLLIFFLVPLKIMFFFVLTLIFIAFSHMQFLSSWIFMFTGLSSIIVGAKSAVGENEIKKFLAFTSINQFGFALLAISVPSFLAIVAAYIFIFVYSISMLLFLYVPCRSFSKSGREAFLFLNHFAYYNLFSKRHAVGDSLGYNNNSGSQIKFGLEFRFLIIIFSLIGVPPLPGFGAKFMIFFVLSLYHHTFIVFSVLLISLISAYYYLNLIYKMFNKSESSSFVLSENYFKFVNDFYLEILQLALTIFFLLLSFFILDVTLFYALADILFFTTY